MQRLLAILLFAAFLLPVAVPALSVGQGPEATLPTCCRRNGLHHCAMAMEAQRTFRAEAKRPQWQVPHPRCPFCPATPAQVHVGSFPLPMVKQELLTTYVQPAGWVQTGCPRRVGCERSRYKRGPPHLVLS